MSNIYNKQELTAANDFLKIFEKDLFDTKKAYDLYFALCNNRWNKGDMVLDFSWRAAGEFIASLRNSLNIEKDDPDICQRCHQKKENHLKVEEEISFPWALKEKEDKTDPIKMTYFFCDKEGGDRFLAGYLGAEDYIDYYSSGGEGNVADWVLEKFESNGYQRSSYIIFD